MNRELNSLCIISSSDYINVILHCFTFEGELHFLLSNVIEFTDGFRLMIDTFWKIIRSSKTFHIFANPLSAIMYDKELKFTTPLCLITLNILCETRNGFWNAYRVPNFGSTSSSSNSSSLSFSRSDRVVLSFWQINIYQTYLPLREFQERTNRLRWKKPLKFFGMPFNYF